MNTRDFDYHLDESLIAQTPAEPRDNSRLMVVNRNTGSIEHHHFYDLPKFLRNGDILVLNNSRVFPARLFGKRANTGAHIEITLLHRISPNIWRSLVRPGRRMRIGDQFEIGECNRVIRGEVLKTEKNGARILRLHGQKHLSQLGVVPLPPYIHEPLTDPERYQTVYSRVLGSIAAPTAGLHFTPELIQCAESVGAKFAHLTLHVGWDSFRPVKTETVESHELNSEYYELGKDAAEEVNSALREGRRVISIGTTSVRLLEHVAAIAQKEKSTMEGHTLLSAGIGWADTFIVPGHDFQVVSSLVTNFHLPRSTLLMLTCAFAGRDLVLRAYAEASDLQYRFYSFGDAMLIV